MRTLTVAVITVVLLATGTIGQQRRQQDIDLQAAIRTETVDGDLNGAIKQYRAIVERYAQDRPVAAQALVHMADCYQKLGDAEAQKIYQQILRDYADQGEATALARARLGNAGVPVSARGDRPAWTGPKVDLFGQVSTDGRYITYVDWGGDGNLMVHDLITNTDRALTMKPSMPFAQFAGFSTISKDSKQVAYAWSNEKGRYDLRILPLQGTAFAEPRKAFDGNDDIKSIAPADWSSDGKWIAVNLLRADGTGQIGLVAVANGALRVLKSVDWRGAGKIAFSPDDRYIAYDLAVGDTDAERRVYVMAADGSSETTLVADHSRNVVMAWAPDGRDVLFASDRSGETALWRQSVVNGKAQGRPTLLKRDIGSSVSLGLTRAGTMYVYKSPSANFVQVASLDLGAAKIRHIAVNTFQRFVGSGGTPSWSNDGKYLVYKSCGPEPRAVCAINIASVDSGDVRQGWPKLSYLGGFRMSGDGRSFLAVGRDVKGRPGAYLIDARSFEISPIVTPRPGDLEQWSPDEKMMYFRTVETPGRALVARDLATGAERELFRQPDARAGSMKISPDGRYIASVSGSVSGAALYLIPTAGGAPKVMLRFKSGEFDGYRAEWTADGRSLVLPKRINDQAFELWLVPMFDGGEPRKLDADTSGWVLPGGGFAIHPSGRQIAYVGMAGKEGAEVWALENFLPASSTR